MTGLARWWHSGSQRIRLRRKLFLFSLPILLLLLAVAVKLVTLVVVGRSMVSDFQRHDIEALRTDISVLSIFNVIEPDKLTFAEGDLRVLEGRLTDAEAQFAKVLARTAHTQSCPVRINLELVRETLGDMAARNGDKIEAERRYRSALELVREATPGCFADNDDPDEVRRKIRHETEPRLLDKIERLHRPPPPEQTPISPPPETPPRDEDGRPLDPENGLPPPDIEFDIGGSLESGAGGADAGGGGGSSSMNDVSPDRLPTSGGGRRPGHQLKPGSGDPMDRLREALGNANASGSSSE